MELNPQRRERLISVTQPIRDVNAPSLVGRQQQSTSPAPSDETFRLPSHSDLRNDQYPKTPNGINGLRLGKEHAHTTLHNFINRPNTSIEALFFSHSPYSAHDLSALFQKLNSDTVLRHLILSNNPVLTDVASQSQFAVAALADLLKVNHTIGWLVLNKTAVGNFGVTTIADALKDNKGVLHLVLSDNEIGDIGAEALGDMLGQNSTIQSLFLQGNSDITSSGVAALLRGLKANTSLKTLDLRDIGHVDPHILSELKQVAENKGIRLAL